MKKLLEYIVESIVDNKEKVKVTETKGEYNETILNLSVAEEDMGKVIGKEGKIIKAIRTIVRILAIKNGERVTINLEEKLPKAEKTDLPSQPEQNQ